jgi:glycerol kinase
MLLNTGDRIVPSSSGLLTTVAHALDDTAFALEGSVAVTGACTKAHLARAALEATCFQTRDVLDAMVADCGAGQSGLRLLKVDGGATRPQE